MLELRFEKYRVEIADDETYSFNSVDNRIMYDSVYGDGASHYSSKCGILIFEGEQLRNSALIYAGGGATGVHEHSAIICNGYLFICHGNKLFSLSLPDLGLRWATKADDVCCFGVFEYDRDLIVHGELNVSRIDFDGNEKWSTTFADITVTPDGTRSFHMHPDYIEVTDWELNRYSVDYQTGHALMLNRPTAFRLLHRLRAFFRGIGSA